MASSDGQDDGAASPEEYEAASPAGFGDAGPAEHSGVSPAGYGDPGPAGHGGAGPGEGWATADGVTGRGGAGLADELAGRLGQVEAQLAEFNRRAAHREAVIDRLHEENQRLRGGFGRLVLEPVVTDLIRLHDQLDREVRRLRTDGQDSRLVWSFAEDVAQILDRCGIEIFSAEPGDPFERDRHRPLAAVACDDESRHGTVAEIVAAGFLERDTGRVRRPVQVRVYRYSSPAV